MDFISKNQLAEGYLRRGLFEVKKRIQTFQSSMGESNVKKNNGILGKSVLLRRCLTMRKYVAEVGD